MSRRTTRSVPAAALVCFSLSITPACAGVVFSESFESPVVVGYDDNTVPGGGKWIGSTVGYNATHRGLYNETYAWPDTSKFTTPYGVQAYFLNYQNSGLTTAVGVIGQTLTANVSYKVSFNTAAPAGFTSGNYKVELVAFGPADDNTARKECRTARPGTVLASATGSVTTTDMSATGAITFTPDGANAHLGKDLGIRLVYSGSNATNSILYDNIRLITGHDMNPSPASGEDVGAGGNVTLNWTNMPPVSPATTTPVDIWFGTNPASLTQVVDGQLASSTVVNALTAGTYYWRVDSHPDGDPNGTPITGDVFFFTISDTDGDGLPDSYELAHTAPSSPTSLNPTVDVEPDGLTNSQEYFYGTNPNNADTDGDTLLDGPELTGVGSRPATSPVKFDTDDDGLSDGVETNTGVWVGSYNTGTNPVDPDWDKDGLNDGVETNTGTLVDKSNTGTTPYESDTDHDGVGDWYEITASFTDPHNSASLPALPYPLPDPDGSTGVTNKPVKVYIMSGQSNMVGMGTVSGITDDRSLEYMTVRQHKFPNLINGSGAWTNRGDVLYRGVRAAIGNGPLAPGFGNDDTKIGPELGFGHIMGWYHDEPVLLLKSSTGNRSLGYNVLPPGSPSYQYNGYQYAGYGQSPGRWLIGSTPTPSTDWAGNEYDRFFTDESQWGVPSTPVTNVVDVLDNFAAEYPQWAVQGFEIAGFVWWQGDADRYDMGRASRYEQNLVNLITSLRTYYSTRYPGKVRANAPFVLATLGQTVLGSTSNLEEKAILDGMLAVDGTSGKYPQFAGNVKTVYSHPLSEGGASNSHYNGRAGTYMLVGDALGRAMLALQDDHAPPSPITFKIEPTAQSANSIGLLANTAGDISGPVQYWFEIVGGANSGWTTSTAWEFTGLSNGTSYDFRFKAKDAKGNESAWSATVSTTASAAGDTTAPSPNSMNFANPLSVLGENSIAMTATTASDINGVQYQFVCTVGGGPSSGWQASPQFTATGLTPGTSYTYIVRAKDAVGNTTADSATASATTLAPDTTPPAPATMSFASPPTAHGTDTIGMTAVNASDPSGVEYFFEEISGNSGGTSSGWQSSVTYIDSGLQPGTQYTYRVRARDKSPAQTATNWSAAASATTDVPDTIAPETLSFSPSNGATNIAVNSLLTITFNEEIVTGTGSITLKNLTDNTQIAFNITDGSQVTVTGTVLTIDPTANLANGKTYAIQIAATAIEDLFGNAYAGITDDVTWSFTTVATAPGTYTWTGGVDGNWTNAGNWDSNGVPVDFTPATSGLGFQTSTSNRIVINAGAFSPNASVPQLYATSGTEVIPTIDVINGIVSFNAGSSFSVSGLVTDSNYSATIGDGIGSKGSASITYNTGYYTIRAGAMAFVVKSDGALVFNTSNSVLSYGTVNSLSVNIAGGSVAFTKAIDLLRNSTAAGNSYFNFTAADAKFTAPFGLDFPGIAAVNTYIGTGLTFRSTNGLTLAATDNGNGTFTVAVVPSNSVNSFTISSIASPQTVGTPVTNITITAKDASNATTTGFTGTVTFGGTGGFSGTSGTFTAGVLTGVSVTPTVAGSNLTLTVTDGSGHTGSTTIATINPAPTAYDLWANQIADPNKRGRAYDADGDGFDNGQEYLFGTSPSAANGSLTTSERSGANLILRWQQRSTGAGYILQQSGTLANDWVTSGVVPANDGAAVGGYQPRMATIPIGSDKLFFRIRGVEN